MNKIRLLVLSLGLAFSFAFSAYADAPNVDFIDVSHHNKQDGLPLSFYQTIKSGGVNAVVVKVSEGTYYVDTAASVNIANAKASGMITHAYHFARFTSIDSAKKEAQWFDKKLKLVGFDKKKDGYVVVDVEASNLSTVPFDLTVYTNSFISEMFEMGYYKVDVYSGSYYYNKRLIPSNLLISKPWLASYPRNPVKSQPTANFTNGQGAWQWSSDYHFVGINGRFDVSEDYSGKYTYQVKSSTVEVKKIGSVSLVNYMKEKGMDFSYANRAKLAASYGIERYRGTAAQNLALLAKLQSGVKPAKLNISNSKLTTSAVPKSSTYIVRRGDTLGSIAKRYNTTVRVLASINHIRNVNFIHVGQVLKITGNVQPITAHRMAYYTVRKGDSVSVIANRYGSSIANIKAWNRLNNRYLIFPNQKLRVR